MGGGGARSAPEPVRDVFAGVEEDEELGEDDDDFDVPSFLK